MKCDNNWPIGFKVEDKMTLDEGQKPMAKGNPRDSSDLKLCNPPPPPKQNLLQGNMALSFNQYRHILDNLRIGNMNNQINTVQSGETVCSIFIF